jgi:hypothetical protein
MQLMKKVKSLDIESNIKIANKIAKRILIEIDNGLVQDLKILDKYSKKICLQLANSNQDETKYLKSDLEILTNKIRELRDLLDKKLNSKKEEIKITNKTITVSKCYLYSKDNV